MWRSATWMGFLAATFFKTLEQASDRVGSDPGVRTPPPPRARGQGAPAAFDAACANVS